MSLASGLVTPIPYSTIVDALNNLNSAPIGILWFLDFSGIGANTYSPTKNKTTTKSKGRKAKTGF
jgi:hypothetical protein